MVHLRMIEKRRKKQKTRRWVPGFCFFNYFLFFFVFAVFAANVPNRKMFVNFKVFGTDFLENLNIAAAVSAVPQIFVQFLPVRVFVFYLNHVFFMAENIYIYQIIAVLGANRPVHFVAFVKKGIACRRFFPELRKIEFKFFVFKL